MADFGIFRGFGDKLFQGQLPTQLGLIGSEDFGFDPDYKAILDYATTQGYTLPSANQQTLQNQLVVDLKDAGIWSKLDTFAVFATDGDSDFALIDWKRLSDYTAVNSPTFTSNQGFQGNGTSSWINTNFNAYTQGVNYQGLSAAFGYYIKQYDSAPTNQEGVLQATQNSTNRSWIRYTAKALYFHSGSQAYTNFTSQSNQFAMASKNGSTSYLYSNGILQDTLSGGATPVNADFHILRQLSIYSDAQVSMVFMGGDLSSEQSDFYTSFYTNYLSNL